MTEGKGVNRRHRIKEEEKEKERVKKREGEKDTKDRKKEKYNEFRNGGKGLMGKEK